MGSLPVALHLLSHQLIGLYELHEKRQCNFINARQFNIINVSQDLCSRNKNLMGHHRSFYECLRAFLNQLHQFQFDVRGDLEELHEHGLLLLELLG